MSLVDQFESVFRGAERHRYAYDRPAVERVLVVCDLQQAEADAFVKSLESFLAEVADATWRVLSDDDYGDVSELRAIVDAYDPQLIVSYRNVRYATWRWPYSLGVFLNAMTRETDYPVLVMPNPHELPEMKWSQTSTDRVMVLADHLTGDDSLVNWGARFTRPGGNLFLTHVEDDQVFERYLDVIGKLPSIDTQSAREAIQERLLKEPSDYIESCQAVLGKQGQLTQKVVPLVSMGHSLADYVALIKEHGTSLLVFNTKEQDQLALHGKAYTLAVQLRDVPILML